MELRQLRYLVTLDDERHFTRAAGRLHIAQPALSQQIRRLEDELGIALVDRTTRDVALTRAGERLVARARRALAEVDAAAEELSELAGMRSGRVVIGAMRGTGPFDLSVLLAAFHSQHPGIELVVREEPSEVMLQHLHADVLDVAFLAVNRLDAGPDIRLHPLLSEPFVALLAPGHRLARRRRIDMAELRGERFIVFGEGGSLRRIVVQGAREAGFEPLLAFESSELPRIRAMAARGLGVALLPASEAEHEGPQVAAVPVRNPTIARDVTLAWRANRRHSPAARAFLELSITADATGAPPAPDGAPPAPAPARH
jgi:LysR family transcriptional regulator, transcription activator of glutamate synthase operon